MTNTISRRKAITYLFVIFAVIIMIGVWPLKLISHDYTAKSDEIIGGEVDVKA